jgi:hypothetical protein
MEKKNRSQWRGEVSKQRKWARKGKQGKGKDSLLWTSRLTNPTSLWKKFLKGSRFFL